MTLPSLSVSIGADTFGAVDGINKVARALNDLGTKTDAMAGKLKNFSTDMTAIGLAASKISAGVTAAGAGMFMLAQSASGNGDKIAKAARAAGLAGEEYQELAFALGQVSGISEDQFANSMQRLARGIGQAAEGSKSQIDAFTRLGFSQDEIESGAISVASAVDAMNAAMQGMETPAEAAALASVLLGREAASLGPILRESGDQIDGLRDRARDLGIVLSGDALAASEQFADKFDEVSRQAKAMKDQIGSELIPVMISLMNAIQNKVIPGIQALASGIGDVIEWFGGLPEPVQAAVGVIVGAFAVGGPVILAIAAFAGALSFVIAATGPVGLFIAAAAILAAAWIKWGDDITAAVKSALDAVTSAFNSALDFIKSIPAQMYQIGSDIVQGLIDGLAAKWEELKERVYALAESLPAWMRELLGIQSPSRVFMEIGEQIGEGLALGIESGAGMVSDAVKRLSDAAIGASGAMSSEVLGNLQTIFQGSKKISAGIAAANAWLAFTEVLKDPSYVGRPFARFAAAGAALAAGMNAVKNINSARPGGGSSGSAGGGAAAAPVPLQVSASFSGDFFTRGQVETGVNSLLDNLLSEARRRGINLAVTA